MVVPELPPAQETSIGTLLRNRRQERRLSVENIATELNLTSDVIRALEDNDYKRLPEPVYTRGYIRAYARFLQLDDESMVAMYSNITDAAESSRLAPPVDGVSRTRSRKITVISVIVACVLAGLVLAHWLQERERRIPVPLEEPPSASDEQRAAPTSAKEPPTQPTASGQLSEWQALEQAVVPGVDMSRGTEEPSPREVEFVGTTSLAAREKRLVLRFNEQCWTEIRDASGRLLIGKLAAAGEQLHVGGEEPLSLLLGNAYGVSLEYSGQRIELAPFTRGNVARLIVGQDTPPTRPR